jgi:hypothetical protein
MDIAGLTGTTASHPWLQRKLSLKKTDMSSATFFTFYALKLFNWRTVKVSHLDNSLTMLARGFQIPR